MLLQLRRQRFYLFKKYDTRRKVPDLDMILLVSNNTHPMLKTYTGLRATRSKHFATIGNGS